MHLRFTILVCLVAASFAAPKSQPKLRPSRLRKTEDNVCTTEACQEAAYLLKQAMDTTADPCTDFYQFACGNYPATTPQELTSYSKYEELKLKNIKTLQAIFEDPYQHQDPVMYKIVKDYYAACINVDEIQEAGLQPRLNLLKQLGGWPVADLDWDEGNSDSWITILYKLLDSGLGYDYVFGLRLVADKKTHTNKSIQMEQPYPMIYSRRPENGPSKRKHKEFLDQIIEIAESFGANPIQAANDMENVLLLERELLKDAKSSTSERKAFNVTSGPQANLMEDPMHIKSGCISTDFKRFKAQDLDTHEIDLKWLNEAAPSVNWEMFFKKNLQTESLQKLRIVTKNQDYIRRATQLLDATPKRTATNYLLLRAILETDKWDHVDQQSQRAVVCTEETRRQLPFITANMFLNKTSGRNVKELADDMADKLRAVFKKHIQTADWLDEVTKKIAIDKLVNVDVLMVYPEELSNLQFLEKLHSTVKIQHNTYFENMLNTQRLHMKALMAELFMSRKQFEWYKKAGEVTLVDASYISTDNAIWIPAGIVQGAFFDANRPQSMNFGGLGIIIGHEFTHGFDNTGVITNKDGIMEDWMMPEAHQNFMTKAECLINQFFSVYIPEINRTISGTQTLSDNIADNGGYSQAYEAYEEWLKTSEPDPVLPGLDFNHRQLFWLNYANAFCEKILPAAFLKRFERDSHAPPKYRVNVGFQNFEAFARDFGCAVGSPMNPVKKCRIW